MPYCINCGIQLPDNANFCYKCGAAQYKPAGDAAPPRERIRETCVITCETVGERWGIYPREIMRFTARAVGPQGEYIAGVSPEFEVVAFNINGPEQKNRRHKAAFDALVNELVKKGWCMADESGDSWFNIKLARDIDETTTAYELRQAGKNNGRGKGGG